MTEFEKGQAIRLADVFVLGPFMVWFAWKAEEMGDLPRAALAIAGFLTAVYNGRNYLLNRRYSVAYAR